MIINKQLGNKMLCFRRKDTHIIPIIQINRVKVLIDIVFYETFTESILSSNKILPSHEDDLGERESM